MNTDILKGLLSLLLLTTLLWSLNLNFNITETNWLEMFGVTSLAFIVGAVFFTKKQ
jgi:hypothetical protein|tara:strand:- start:51 stop:218 length:168 start_codon:yes stop_codon:yes gene_type:complete